MRVPAITYRAAIDETYDFGFYRLPNLISHTCFNFKELESMLQQILDGQMGPADGNDRDQLIRHYLAAQFGPLACERMMDVIENIVKEAATSKKSGMVSRLAGRSLWAGRTLIKRYKDSRPGSHNRPEFQRHRYPELSTADIRERILKFQHILNHRRELKVEKFLDQFFKISP